MKKKLTFKAFRKAKPWTGRYARIPGKEPAFHISRSGVITARWIDYDEDESFTAEMVETPDTKALAKALNKVKSEHTGHAGGSFLINEYGQVISPIRNTKNRYWVGDLDGIPEFSDPLNGGTFNLRPGPNVRPGTRWNGPYIGMKFNLSADDRIYFNHENDDGRQKFWLKKNDLKLVKSLREIREEGTVVRFIVNLHGAVFTKVEVETKEWRPFFVGFIDYEKWFPKES